MEPRDEQRRLTVILAADMVGYSRLMEADERGTVAQLRVHRRELIDPKIADHRGHVLKRTGDGALVEFGSVADAVLCAVEIQRGMARRNADVPGDRRIAFRIGIDIGDIVIDDDDFHGTGVITAARLEGLAEPGGVYVSRAVYNRVKTTIDAGFEALGERRLKNLDEPVEVYRVVTEGEADRTAVARRGRMTRSRWRWAAAGAVVVVLIAGAAGGYWTWDNWWRFQSVEAASLERMAIPLPENPSIAVLPFDNLSGDPGQDILADGLSEDIITALSKLPELFVISRDSTFAYKGEPVSVHRVAEKLSVHHVLEGSVQQAGDQIRVTAQLVEALSGEYLWADRFSREAADLFAVRDEIILNVVSSVGAEIAQGDRNRLLRRETDSLEAWLLYREAYAKVSSLSAEEIIPARALLQRAIAIDPGFVSAHATLGVSYRMEGQFWPGDKPPEEHYQLAGEHFDRAIALDPSHGYARLVLAGLHLARNEFDEAVTEAEFAAAREPSSWISHAILGWALTQSVQPNEAIAQLKLAMRLNPVYPDWVLGEYAHAHLLAGELAQAREAYRQLLLRDPNRIVQSTSRVRLALILANLGQDDEARHEIATAVEIFPQVSVSFLNRTRSYKDPAVSERFSATWRRLGMPE